MSFTYYAKFTGKKQGLLKGESKKQGRSDWSECVAFEMGSAIPVDATSGEPKGSRRHDPITLTKEAGGCSPLLLNAHWSGEQFDEVVVEIINRNQAGAKEQVIERITMKDAVIVKMRRFSATHAKDSVDSDVDHLEEVGFRFRQIQIDAPLASTSAADDWLAPGS
jgi:type VI secretion system secreted protein Hcp